MPDLELLRWCQNDKERHIVQAVFDSGSNRKAAAVINMARQTIDANVAKIKNRAALDGYAPDHSLTRPAPEGLRLKGVSTFHQATDDTPAQWVKLEADKAKQEELMKEAVRAMCEEIKPEKKVKAPKGTNKDLLNLYVLTDYHLGMLAWHEETGDDWDTKIAESLLYSWFAEAIERSPDSEECVLAQLGDFLHTDGLEPLTPASKNILDADSRYQKIVRVAIRALRRIIRDLLEKHKKVHVILAEGNHDPASSIWLREAFPALFEKEPRCHIDQSPDPYYAYEFGNTSLFFHHGHKRKVKNIDHVFAGKFRELWGKTKHSYGHTGHLHEQNIVETNLMKVEQHPTLAAPDAYASRGGWLSERNAKVITYHKEHGEVSRLTISPDMLKKAA